MENQKLVAYSAMHIQSPISRAEFLELKIFPQNDKSPEFLLTHYGSLSDRMNGHRFTTMISNPDLPVAIHTQSHQIPFQECWSVSVIHNLPDSTPDHICRQFETAYQLVLQSQHTPRCQHPLTPIFHPRPSGTESFNSVSCILLLRKATVIWPKYSFLFSFFSICLSDAHPRAGRCSRLS